MFKEVPAVQSPTGQKSMLPIPVVRCTECGEVHEKFYLKNCYHKYEEINKCVKQNHIPTPKWYKGEKGN